MKKILLVVILMLGIIVPKAQTHIVTLMGKGFYDAKAEKWLKLEKLDSVRILASFTPARLHFYNTIPGDIMINPVHSKSNDSTMVVYQHIGYDRIKKTMVDISITTTTKYSDYVGFTVYYGREYYIMYLMCIYTPPNKKL